jgi:hypothetical protein
MVFTSDYDGHQDNIGCYNYATSVDSMNRVLPSTPLTLMPGCSTQVLTEYLRLGPKGGIGPVTWHRADAGPKGKRMADPFRTHLNSQFSFSMDHQNDMAWNTACVTFKRESKLMLWTQNYNYWNMQATFMLEHPDARFIFGDTLRENECAMGDAYIILNQMVMPSIDIATDIDDATTFEEFARPALTNGWWRAVQIEGGWRVFSDCEKNLTFARLALS